MITVNDARKQQMAERIVAICGGSVAGRTVAVLGLTFKPNTDDMREAPSLAIIPSLLRRGAAVRVFDPEGMEEARKMLDGVTWCGSAYETVEGADVLAVLTEWNEFRALDLARLKALMRTPVICDLRNIYNPSSDGRRRFPLYIDRPTARPTRPRSSPSPESHHGRLHARPQHSA